MERFSSLINSLKTGFEEGRSVAELLNLLNEMRNELTRSTPAADHTQSPVSIWLPAGYQPQAEKVNSPVAEVKIPETVLEHKEEFPHISNTIKDSLHFEKNNEPVLAAESVNVSGNPLIPVSLPAVANGVPKPPRVAIMEETKNDLPIESTDDTSLISVHENFLLPGNYHVHANGIFHKTDPANQVSEMEFPAEAPIVVELDLPEDTENDNFERNGTREYSMTISENFLKNNKLAVTEERVLELHEILANRVVAQPANGELPKLGKVLADTFSGGKIHDLRKAIAINDRFRFINSLFRADDTLFERSVKTINNFNILQEAQYWMQRELVIKLGWNEEDELVQMFYQLVSRRFL